MGPLLRPEAKDIDFALLLRVVGRTHGLEIHGHHRRHGDPWARAGVEAEMAGDACAASQEEWV